MPFLNNIPQATDEPKNSQPQLLGNNQSLGTWVDVDHYGFSSTQPQQGKHKYVRLQADPGVPVLNANEAALYAVTSGDTGNIEIEFKNSAIQVEMTAADASLTGWTRTPSGLLIKWGTGVANGATAIAYPGGAPVFNSVLRTWLQVRSGTTTDPDGTVILSVANYTTAGFEVYGGQRTAVSSPKAVLFNYLTIGT